MRNVLFLIVCLDAATAWSGNFIYNESFESASGGFAEHFAAIETNCTFIRHVTRDPGNAHSGDSFVKLRGLFGDANWLNQKSNAACPVVAGTRYEISAWVKRQNFDAAYSIQLQVAWQNASGGYLSNDRLTWDGFSGSEGAYTQMLFRAEAPAGAGQAVVKVWMRRGEGPDGPDAYVSIDDVALEDYAYTREDIEAVKNLARWSAGDALMAMIESAADDTVIDIDPGYYCFERDWEIRNKSGLVLQKTPGSSGAVHFIFNTDHVTNAAITVVNASQIELCDFVLDYYPPVTSQGRIWAWDANAQTVTMDVDPGFPKPTTAWITSADFGKSDRPKALLFDKESRLLKNMENDYAIGGVATGGDPWRFEISLDGSSMFEQGGWGYDALSSGDSLSFARRCHSTFVLRAEAVTLSNVTVHSSGNVMVGGGYSAGAHRLIGVQAVRKPDSHRLLTVCNAAVHLVGDRAAPEIRNCVFEHLGDDAINVNAHLSIVGDTPATEALLGDQQMVVVQVRANETSGIVAGGELAVFGAPTLILRGRGFDIVAVERMEGAEADYAGVADESAALYGLPLLSLIEDNIAVWKVTLASSVLPNGIERLDWVSPQQEVLSGLVVIDCVLHDVNNNGVVVQAHNSVVQGNVMKALGGSGVVFFPYIKWMEGIFPNDVRIQDNWIEDAAGRRTKSGVRNRGGIVVSALPRYWITTAADEVVSRVYERIQVISNTVIRCGYTPVIIKNTDDVLVANNEIREPLSAPEEVLASLDFSAGGKDEGFNCGIYYNHTTGCLTGGNLFSGLDGASAEYVGKDNVDFIRQGSGSGLLFRMSGR